jgi:uncharacterized damage-inducible protein DinB
MSIAESLLPEFNHEAANTHRVLERVPDERFGWSPHPKSGTMGWLAAHLADMGQWAATALESDSFDVLPPDKPAPQPPPLPKTLSELLGRFDTNLAAAQRALAKATDEQMLAPWALLRSGQEIFRMPRVAVLRGMVLNHMIHHRGQLTVYLRLNDAPVPGLYGPSADEGSPIGGR